MEKKIITLKTRLLISIFPSIIVFVGVFIFSWTNSSGDSPEKIKEIEAAIEKELTDDPINSFTLVFIDLIAEPLFYSNEEIVKAKALVHFKKKPFSSTDYPWGYLWDNRFEVSKRNLKIETFKSKIFKSLGLGIAAIIGVVITDVVGHYVQTLT